MALFGRNIPSKVMASEEPEKTKAPENPDPSPKEKPMEQKAEKKNALLDVMPSKRRPGSSDGSASPAPAAPTRSGNETFISGETVIEGKIQAQGELCVDGTFKGEIISSSRVLVGTAGKLEGTVKAKSLVISGKVIGNLHITERLELLSTGELYGDLETQPGALIIEKGARLEGHCSMGLGNEEKPRQAAPAQQSKPTAPAQPAAPQVSQSGKK
jgi:cytoskeletal protein CcmA (bactofilin family)